MTGPADLSEAGALVVGASGGLGEAISRALAAAGARMALGGRSVAALERVRSTCSVSDQAPVLIQMDVRDQESVKKAMAIANGHLDGVDVVVYCAGISPILKRIEKMSVADWNEIMDTNATGAFLVARAAQAFIRDGGALIFVSSIHEEVAIEGLTAYCASKGAIRMLSRVLALEWAPRGIRVNCVAPGYVATSLTAGLRANPSIRARIENQIPLGHMAMPEDVAGIVVFLASRAAQYISGTTVFVDGGWTAR